jgi:hypothetical protein
MFIQKLENITMTNDVFCAIHAAVLLTLGSAASCNNGVVETLATATVELTAVVVAVILSAVVAALVGVI